MNALVVCNGAIPPQSLLRKCHRWADVVLAADGGANILNEKNLAFDVVIGDMDSYRPLDEEPYDVIHDPDQYSNDLEKALKSAKDRKVTHLKVLGATGLRLDHTLKNLSVLKQFNHQFEQLVFLDEYGLIMLLPAQYSNELDPGTTVSLFPLSGTVTGITTHGLKYPLKNEDLENGVRDGTSNTVTESPIRIDHEKGDLLLFIAN
jgi:thiamine pyrophosphokinase